MAGFTSTAALAAPSNPNNDYILPQPPDDSVSSLAFSPGPPTGQPQPAKSFLVATSWNGCVRAWGLDPGTGAVPVAEKSTGGAPLLDCAWAQAGDAVFTACADGTARMWKVQDDTFDVVAKHDSAIRCCVDVPNIGFLVTGSWDKTVKYWDARAPTGVAAGSVPVGDRVYAMDAVGWLLVVGVADRGMLVYDVRKPTEAHVTKFSSLKYQTRAIAASPSGMSYLVASVDGKVSVDYVKGDANSGRVIKCHRDDQGNSYGINDICFHDQEVFATGGSDGYFAFWNAKTQQPATSKPFEKMNAPVTAIDFSADSALFAYATGYDWNSGANGLRDRSYDSNIFIHTVADGELRPGSSTGNANGGGGFGGGGGRSRSGGNRNRSGGSRTGGGGGKSNGGGGSFGGGQNQGGGSFGSGGGFGNGGGFGGNNNNDGGGGGGGGGGNRSRGNRGSGRRR